MRCYIPSFFIFISGEGLAPLDPTAVIKIKQRVIEYKTERYVSRSASRTLFIGDSRSDQIPAAGSSVAFSHTPGSRDRQIASKTSVLSDRWMLSNEV